MRVYPGDDESACKEVSLKGEVNPIFLFHHWVRIGQTKTSFNRQFSPKRPEVGQIFILRSNFDQNKDHMTSKQVRGPSKNWHSASEGTLKTDIQQVRGPSKLTSCKWGDPQNWHRASEGTLKTDIQQVRGPYFDIQQVRGRYFVANKDLSRFTHFLEIFGQKKCLFVE